MPMWPAVHMGKETWNFCKSALNSLTYTYFGWLLSVQLHAPKIGWRFIYYFAMVTIVLLAAIVVQRHLGQLKALAVLLGYVYIFTPMLKMCPVVSRVDMCSKWPNQWQVMMIDFLRLFFRFLLLLKVFFALICISLKVVFVKMKLFVTLFRFNQIEKLSIELKHFRFIWHIRRLRWKLFGPRVRYHYITELSRFVPYTVYLYV